MEYTSLDPKYLLKRVNDRQPAAKGSLPPGRTNVERRRCQMVVRGGYNWMCVLELHLQLVACSTGCTYNWLPKVCSISVKQFHIKY